VVTDAEVADLDHDGSPELYVQVRTTDARAQGTLLAVAANRRRSLSDIHLPALADGAPVLRQGYRGQDQFALGEGRLLRRFPVYLDGDADGQPAGGVRQIQYRLVQGEASWQLVVDRLLAF
jgi:hypothetical protein